MLFIDKNVYMYRVTLLFLCFRNYLIKLLGYKNIGNSNAKVCDSLKFKKLSTFHICMREVHTYEWPENHKLEKTQV